MRRLTTRIAFYKIPAGQWRRLRNPTESHGQYQTRVILPPQTGALRGITNKKMNYLVRWSSVLISRRTEEDEFGRSALRADFIPMAGALPILHTSDNNDDEDGGIVGSGYARPEGEE